MLVSVYKRPHGNVEVIDLVNINQEDADWFEENNVSVSMEDTGPVSGIVVYADVGLLNEDDEPDEVIVFAGDEDCFSTMKRLRAECEKALSGE